MLYLASRPPHGIKPERTGRDVKENKTLIGRKTKLTQSSKKKLKKTKTKNEGACNLSNDYLTPRVSFHFIAQDVIDKKSLVPRRAAGRISFPTDHSRSGLDSSF